MATASLLPPARSVFYNASTGEALAGGFVYTYVPGGVTPKQTWQDAGETTLNTNPIVLDASGSALIYGNGSYQITVTDSLGNQIPGYSGLTSDSATQTGISAAMLPVVQASTTTQATSLLTYKAPAAGSVTRSLTDRFDDFLTAADYGAQGDGATDDTAAIQAAIDASVSQKKTIWMVGEVGSNFIITSPLNINSAYISLQGDNRYTTLLTARGTFDEIMLFGSNAAGCRLEHIGFVQTGTNTRCFTINYGAQVIVFNDCNFTGNLNGYLCYSQGSGFIEFYECGWEANAANTQGMVWDAGAAGPANLNCNMTSCVGGGVGTWVSIINSPGIPANALQGLRIENCTTECTGQFNIAVGGNAYLTQIIGTVVDQGVGQCILVGGGAFFTQIVSSWIGLTQNSVGVGILIDVTAGGGTLISDNVFYGGNGQCISCGGSGALTISGNVFSGNNVTTTLFLGGVNGAIISGNLDLNNPTNGSWNTVGTGAYTFSDNIWSINKPVSFDTNSGYRGSGDRGILLDNKAAVSVASGPTSLVVNHGLVSTPNYWNATPSANVGNWWIDTIDAASFTIHWTTPAAVTWTWNASIFS